MFDPTVNLGNVLTIAGLIGGGLFGFHRWDKRVDERHQSNLSKQTEFSDSIKELEKAVEKMEVNANSNFRVLEAKLYENRETAHSLDKRLIVLEERANVPCPALQYFHQSQERR